MAHDHGQAPRSWYRTRTGLAFLGLLVIAGFFLLTEHRAHALGALPFILLALCPLLHLFGHGGHGHGGHEPPKGDRP
ncbi:hypothetical protein SVA_3264 [Sulfurifustis variabilis]|uniref:DUF2933 domain-containing protein n=1 Tax=Sulfurifustis variabilis TaxID=1675686 RepID=A0A1C7AF16_9GAMM|nr:DUF2933 domain-containing protein [Sulfurifustis variabilis]BAU49812.1 hypothetical protein SVA_3264 [Sulfurifustis variabilis]